MFGCGAVDADGRQVCCLIAEGGHFLDGGAITKMLAVLAAEAQPGPAMGRFAHEAQQDLGFFRAGDGFTGQQIGTAVLQ